MPAAAKGALPEAREGPLESMQFSEMFSESLSDGLSSSYGGADADLTLPAALAQIAVLCRPTSDAETEVSSLEVGGRAGDACPMPTRQSGNSNSARGRPAGERGGPSL